MNSGDGDDDDDDDYDSDEDGNNYDNDYDDDTDGDILDYWNCNADDDGNSVQLVGMMMIAV